MIGVGFRTCPVDARYLEQASSRRDISRGGWAEMRRLERIGRARSV
jgi:hypothetical protein